MHIAMNENSHKYDSGFVLTMIECLTIDDNDEEDHRWFFSCPDPVKFAKRGVTANGYGIFLFTSYSDYTTSGEKNQVITRISVNGHYYGLISG
jgi:hypothetical protein